MTFQPTIRSQADLWHAWTTLMGPLGFSRSSLWLMLIGPDDRPVPSLSEIEQAQQPPDDEETARVAEILRMLREEVLPGGRFAFLRSRPGGGGITDSDRAWAQALYQAGRTAGVPIEVVHRACDVDLIPIPRDDLLAHSA